MTLLQFFFIISGIIIFIIAFDISKKQKFNALHFLIFLGVGGGLLVFSFFPNTLNSLAGFFGVAKGSDVLVYSSIIFLFYFVLLLLAKHVSNKDSITDLIRELAIERSEKKYIEGNEVILIRSYNEGSVIGKVLQEIIDEGYKNILIIDDGSRDNSSEVFDKYKDNIILIRHYRNRGAGAALETGFEYIRRYGKVKYIVNFDADGQHNVKDVKRFLKEFENDKNLGVVLGSRFIEKTNTNVPFIRKITLFLGRIFTMFVSGVYLTDAHNGYRAFTLKAVKSIKLTIDTMAYASELIEEISVGKIKYKEIPVDILYTDYSIKKGQGSGNAISIALRFIWNKFFR